MAVLDGTASTAQPRTPVEELFKEQLAPLGLSEQQTSAFSKLISGVAGQAVQEQLKLQKKHDSVVRDLQATVASVLGLVQQQAAGQQALQTRLGPEGHQFKNQSFGRRGKLALETLSVGRATIEVLEACVAGNPVDANQAQRLVERLTSLLEQQQKTYEYCVVADVDGPKVAMQLEGTAQPLEFGEEFEKKRKAAKEAVAADEKAAAKRKKEEAAAKAAAKKPIGMPGGGGFGPAHYKALGGKPPLYCYSCGKLGHVAQMCPGKLLLGAAAAPQ